MKPYTEILEKSTLFKGLESGRLKDILFYLNPQIKRYKKGAVLILAGTAVRSFAIVLEGRVQIIKEDIYGTRSIIAQCAPAEMFAEALACAKVDFSPVTVVAEEDSLVMWIDFNSLLKRRFEGVDTLIRNMLMLLARKNVFLNSKLEHVSKRTIREKLLSYLQEQQLRSGGKKFTLPYNRTDLADFLFIDRSAMTRELSHMREAGIIDFEKNVFTIK